MGEERDGNCPLVDIARTLRGIPDRGEPCDREIAPDGTEIILEGDMGDKPQYS